MSFNIMDMVKGQISDQLVGQIGGLLGESPDKARNAVDSALPTLMAGIGESAQEEGGADTLLNLVNRQDDNVIDNIGSMIGSNQSSELIESGTRGLGSLMGSKGVTSMISGLAGHTGLGKGSAGSLLGMLTPMVMGQLKRKSSADGLNASGLASMLKGQGSNISAAMPQGMLKHLEAAGFGERSSGGYSGGKVAAGAAAATAAAGAAAGTARRGASNVTSTTSQATRSTAQTATATAGNAANRTANTARTAASSATTAANRPVESARSATASAATATRNAASSAANTTSRVASNAKETARDAAGSATRSVERGVDAAGNKVGGAVDSTRTATSNTARSASNTTAATTRTADTTTRTSATRDSSSNYDAPKKSGGIWKWLLPLALAILAWFGFKQLGTKDVDVADTATGVAESTTEAVAGGLGGQLTDFFGTTSETLGGITDADSATAALPKLETAQESLTGMLSGADDSAKAAASDAVKTGMDSLGPIVDKLKGDSGIWGVLEPVLGPMMETLKGLMG